MTPERESLFASLRRAWPPPPWAKWEDGEWFGFSASWTAWKMFLFPYRTAEFKGYDDETLQMDLGPWHWHAPGLWRALRG